MDESRGDEPVALFGANLRRFREAFDWSQSELARRMQDGGWPKYSQVAVSRTEEGSRAVRLDEAIALAGLFGLKLQDLLRPGEVTDTQMRTRMKIDSLTDEIGLLRSTVREVETERLALKALAQMLRQHIDDAGGDGEVEEIDVKTLQIAETVVSKSTEAIVTEEIEKLRKDWGFESDVDFVEWLKGQSDWLR